MKMTYQTGLSGEKTAAEWLEKNAGMRLLETRYRNKAGEIDLIMTDGDTIVFVEVKTRLNAPAGTGLLAVDRKNRSGSPDLLLCIFQETAGLTDPSDLMLRKSQLRISSISAMLINRAGCFTDKERIQDSCDSDVSSCFLRQQ